MTDRDYKRKCCTMALGRVVEPSFPHCMIKVFVAYLGFEMCAKGSKNLLQNTNIVYHVLVNYFITIIVE